MPATKLTTLERDVLRAFWLSQYVDGDERPSTWTWDVVTGCNVATTRNVAGVFASLVKKGLVTVSGSGKEAQADVTADGFDAALAAGLIVGKPILSGSEGRERVYWKAAEVPAADVKCDVCGKPATRTNLDGGNVCQRCHDDGFSDEMPIDEPTPRKRTKRNVTQKLVAKSARRIVRAYLRAAIEAAMLAEAGDFDEALDLRLHQLDAQLDAALEVLA
jgi:hypothetical protein